jgi:pimeloyl-ACP methyl ester carboxylesterase
MRKLSVRDGSDSFDVALFEAAAPSAAVLFAVGGGGNPERHLPLMTSLHESGCTVVAPYFERLVTPIPTEADLIVRARRLRLALDQIAQPGLPTTGVGHSIGATMLLALAGGQAWMRDRTRLDIVADPRLARLVLMAPATDFFRAPGALEGVCLPIQVWAASKDVITPPAQAEFLRQALGNRAAVELDVVEDADHFSFMDVRPPQTTESLPNREAFLAELAAKVVRFVAGTHASRGSTVILSG